MSVENNGHVGGVLSRPLEGIRVADFSAMMAGPYCTRWLADLGADIVKIEPREGDTMRAGAPLRNGRSAYFGHLNAGKRSVVLDLKDPDALEAARQIIAGSDVLLENFRPGVMGRLGLGWEAMRASHPRLIYCSISGYGQHGPKANRPSYAPIVQAASGYELAHFSYQDGLTQPANSGLFAADVLAACYATMAIQAALLQRAKDGRGQYLDVSLMESILSMMVYEFQEAQFPSERRKHLYVPMATVDGFVIIAPVSQRNFVNMCEAMGHPEWKTDRRFADPSTRRQHWNELAALMRAWTADRSSDECESTLLSAGVPCSRYSTVRDVIGDPHFADRGSFAHIDDGAAPFLVPNLPFRMSGAHNEAHESVPCLGQHTREVLDALTALPATVRDRLVAQACEERTQ